MTIPERLMEDMKASMKAGESERTSVLRLLRGALKNEQIKAGHELDEAESLKVIQREAKQRRDSIEAYREAGRLDLAEAEERELAIIAGYLPELMSRDELAVVVDAVIAESDTTDIKQMGQVIGAVMAKVGTRADGAMVSGLVREKLAA